ncbi:hypothetical protein LguiB_030324 [Lonicera macranthoides]
MSVLIVTSLGDIVVDLHADLCPLTSKNFLKLCKIKYYNGCLFHTVQKDFTAQTGDPTGTGSGGDSIYKFLYGDQARFFGDEIRLDLKHSKMGTVAMASAGEDLNASQFYITLRDDIYYLDGKHTVFGEVAEGLEMLNRINEAYVDEKGRPYKNIRIKHTYVLDDPFDDPPQLSELVPDASPEGKPKDEVDDEVRLEDDWVPMDEQLAPGELEEVIRTKEAHSRAVVLESIGDIPDAEIKPPDNVLFVCKLNPVTEDEDLHTIFSRFGTVTSADIIRDYKTGDSLCYAFIEFENKDSCEQAYFKMDNALIDDRRIHVDFSQSVAKLWSQYKRKDNPAGRGCFKCGSLDHIAKDCTGSPTGKQQTAKYILKDNNTQRGGDNNSGYEMVFDGDKTEIPRRNKRQRDHEAKDHYGKQKLNRQSSDELKQRDYKTRDLHDPNRQHERSKEYSRSEIHHRSRTSPAFGREKKGQSTKDELDYKRKADGGGSRRDRRDDRSSRENDDSRGDKRDDRGEYKRSEGNDHRGYRRGDERRGHSYTKSTDRIDKRYDDKDYYKKRSADSGRDDDRSHRLDRADDGRRGSRDDTYDRKIQTEDDGRKSSRGEERNKKSTKSSDGYYDRARDRDRRH